MNGRSDVIWCQRSPYHKINQNKIYPCNIWVRARDRYIFFFKFSCKSKNRIQPIFLRKENLKKSEKKTSYNTITEFPAGAPYLHQISKQVSIDFDRISFRFLYKISLVTDEWLHVSIHRESWITVCVVVSYALSWTGSIWSIKTCMIFWNDEQFKSEPICLRCTMHTVIAVLRMTSLSS